MKGAIQLTKNNAHIQAAASFLPTNIIVFYRKSAAKSNKAYSYASTEKKTAQEYLARAYSATRPPLGIVPK